MIRALERKADRLVQEATARLWDACLVCGERNGVMGHHIVHRSQCRGALYGLRHDLCNIMPLCVACHVPFAHGQPKEFDAWFAKTYPAWQKGLMERRAGMLAAASCCRTLEYLEETCTRLRLGKWP